MEQQIYFGVCEDRDDPLYLGRCRIRIIGVHTPDKTELPTEGLPWAVPIQPITSAAVSGIGHAPVGPVESTWCAVMFTDPESKQQPVFFGTVAGIPTKENLFDEPVPPQAKYQEGVLVDSSGTTVTDSSGEPIRSGSYEAPPASATPGVVGTLTQADLDNLKAVLRKRESSNNYSAVNTLGFVGAYQFGMAMLEDLGYVKKGSWAKYGKNKYLAEDAVWAGKDGINKQSDFLAAKSVQDKAVQSQFQLLFNRMSRSGMASDETPRGKLAGLLFVAHLKGLGKGGVRDFLKGQATPDGYGTSPGEYYALGYRAVDPSGTVVQADQASINKQEKPIVASGSTTASGAKVGTSDAAVRKGDPSKFGFIDPNLKYPLDTHLNEPDTNRLARHQSIEKTAVSEKQINRVPRVAYANTSTTWEQPNVPYNAKYPFNHVYSSESGHLMEYDDTPNSERIHQYHKSGTFTEIDVSGTQVNRVVGNNVRIVEDDDHIYVMGTGTITVDGDFSIVVKQALHIEVLTDAQIHVHGDTYQTIDGDYDIKCKNFRLQTAETFNVKVGTDTKVMTTSTTDIESTGIMKVHSTAAMHIKTEDDLFQSGKNIHIKAVEDAFVGGNNAHIKAANEYYLDGAFGYAQSGKAQDAADAQPAAPAPEARPLPGWTPTVVVHNTPTYIQSEDFKLEGTDPTGYTSKEEVEADAPVPPVTPTPPDTEVKTVKPLASSGVIEFPITKATRLSPNFTLGDLCTEGMVPAGGQHGLTQEEIVLNLQAVAVNILEPLKQKFPDLKVNNGFRPAGSATSKSKKISQHEKGQAVDIGFLKMPPGSAGRKDHYYKVAQWVKDNIAYDQLLFESTSKGSVWVHSSFNRAGNRTASTPFKVATFVDHKPIGQGLILA